MSKPTVIRDDLAVTLRSIASDWFADDAISRDACNEAARRLEEYANLIESYEAILRADCTVRMVKTNEFLDLFPD